MMQNGDVSLTMRSYESWSEWEETARKQAAAMGLSFADMLPPPLSAVAQLGPAPKSLSGE